MTIGRTGPIEPSRPINESGKGALAGKIAKNDDTVDISTEAYKKADWLSAVEIVSAAPAPGIRADRVAELKAKINDPAYITEALLRGTADKIIDVLWPSGGDKLKF
ncbi:MAG: flagellar biosynthesis anti-sigma factor FlgM [Spirochaetaceae bacterium]|jgi:negative regulator of flagellin synthesis FlgM|nr:flagellar biosynthesis anti-sigma factor FlgM [Spirochaetaceae bacterium]